MSSTGSLVTLLTFVALLAVTQQRCMYDIQEKGEHLPIHTDREAFPLKDLNACLDYLQPGRLGCCTAINDQLMMDNFKQIDSIFGSDGGGCDICAINLKRFWCQYACSKRQDEFMWTASQLRPYPDPQSQGATIMGQQVWARVHSGTACTILNSCKRVPFVASVSAMGSAAGFLNFQGHNALNQGHQYISFNFSNNINDSLAFTDAWEDYPYGVLNTCDYKSTIQLHNYTISQNCTCSTCEQACDSNDGFIYPPLAIFQGFNTKLVLGVYGFVAIVVAGVSIRRAIHHRKGSKRQ